MEQIKADFLLISETKVRSDPPGGPAVILSKKIVLNSYFPSCKQQFFHGVGDAFGVEAAFTMQFDLLAVFDDGIGNTQSFDAGRIAVFGHKFKNG